MPAPIIIERFDSKEVSESKDNPTHDLVYMIMNTEDYSTAKSLMASALPAKVGDLFLDDYHIVHLGNGVWEGTARYVKWKSTTTGPRFGVLLEPLKNNFIGTAAVAGCVLTRVLVGSIAYTCAETVAGQNSYLRSVPHGPASVLWIESSGAVRWAVIRFDDANYEEIVFITSNIPDGNGYYPGVVQKFDVASKSWSTIFNCKVVDANK